MKIAGMGTSNAIISSQGRTHAADDRKLSKGSIMPETAKPRKVLKFSARLPSQKLV